MKCPYNLVKIGKKFNRIIDTSMEKRCKTLWHDNLAKIVTDALINHVFSACSVGISLIDNEKYGSYIHHYGYTDSNGKGTRVNDKTVYDLASLTKPLVTSLAIMALVDKGEVALEDEIGTFFNGIRREMGKIRLSHLLSHSAGLPAHRPYYEILMECPQQERKEIIIRLIFKEKLLFVPGQDSLYSDLGYILLGCIVEKLTRSSLDNYWKNVIIQPLGLEEELFFPNSNGSACEECAVTGKCGWSKRRLCGIVHDDNCRALGGVAGHAGLFGTVSGVMSLAQNLFLQFKGISRHPAYGGETLREFLRKKPESTWTYGFDTPSFGHSSSGNYFSEMTVGHLGFTGTSFWLDLSKGTTIVLLTNRVLMGHDLTKIRKFRPLLHDTLMEHIMKKPDRKTHLNNRA